LLRKKPGFPLQFLSLPAAGLRDFRCNPLRPTGFSGSGKGYHKKIPFFAEKIYILCIY
jgi:hypothetical protein